MEALLARAGLGAVPALATAGSPRAVLVPAAASAAGAGIALAVVAGGG